jgi:hypothetical protein
MVLGQRLLLRRGSAVAGQGGGEMPAALNDCLDAAIDAICAEYGLPLQGHWGRGEEHPIKPIMRRHLREWLSTRSQSERVSRLEEALVAMEASFGRDDGYHYTRQQTAAVALARRVLCDHFGVKASTEPCARLDPQGSALNRSDGGGNG